MSSCSSAETLKDEIAIYKALLKNNPSDVTAAIDLLEQILRKYCNQNDKLICNAFAILILETYYIYKSDPKNTNLKNNLNEASIQKLFNELGINSNIQKIKGLKNNSAGLTVPPTVDNLIDTMIQKTYDYLTVFYDTINLPKLQKDASQAAQAAKSNTSLQAAANQAASAVADAEAQIKPLKDALRKAIDNAVKNYTKNSSNITSILDTRLVDAQSKFNNARQAAQAAAAQAVVSGVRNKNLNNKAKSANSIAIAASQNQGTIAELIKIFQDYVINKNTTFFNT